MLKKMIVLLALFALPIAGHAATVQLPKTGQALCYNAAGVAIECTTPEGLGQDGQLQKGVAWPAPRFVDNQDGTVTDELTGLIWLRDPACAQLGARTWAAALAAADALRSGQCGLTDNSPAGAWRVPNVLELESLVDLGRIEPAVAAGNPFPAMSIQESFWTSTTHAHYPAMAWLVNMGDGSVAGDTKTLTTYHVWPVRGGQ